MKVKRRAYLYILDDGIAEFPFVRRSDLDDFVRRRYKMGRCMHEKCGGFGVHVIEGLGRFCPVHAPAAHEVLRTPPRSELARRNKSLFASYPELRTA